LATSIASFRPVTSSFPCLACAIAVHHWRHCSLNVSTGEEAAAAAEEEEEEEEEEEAEGEEEEEEDEKEIAGDEEREEDERLEAPKRLSSKPLDILWRR